MMQEKIRALIERFTQELVSLVEEVSFGAVQSAFAELHQSGMRTIRKGAPRENPDLGKAPKRRGRPPKAPQKATGRPVGRPRKDAQAAPAAPAPAGRRKAPQKAAGRPVGRPRKAAQAAPAVRVRRPRRATHTTAPTLDTTLNEHQLPHEEERPPVKASLRTFVPDVLANGTADPSEMVAEHIKVSDPLAFD